MALVLRSTLDIFPRGCLPPKGVPKNGTSVIVVVQLRKKYQKAYHEKRAYTALVQFTTGSAKHTKKSDVFHISMFYLCEECEENILKLFNIASVRRKMSNENSVCTVVVKCRKQM